MGEINVAIAFAAGLLSFLSPCVLPLIPSYLSFVTGASLGDLSAPGEQRIAILLRTSFFVLGFSVVFVALGILFSGSGLLLAGTSRWINLAAASVVILLGLNVIFDFFKLLNVERRLHPVRRPTSYLGSTLVGMAFGAGWSPCIGPILAGILFMAGSAGDIGRGVLYLSFYSLGLGLPFLLGAIFFSRLTNLLNRVKRHLPTLRIASGVLLIALGLLIASGGFQALSGIIVTSGYRLESWHLENRGASRALFGALLLALGLAAPVVRLTRGRRLSGSAGMLLSALLFLAGLLEVFGATEFALLFARWLTFQGI
ncbi:MAG: cytochrome c biogenesis CcdA family protein [Spirochaetaceae bacterium]